MKMIFKGKLDDILLEMRGVIGMTLPEIDESVTIGAHESLGDEKPKTSRRRQSSRPDPKLTPTKQRRANGRAAEISDADVAKAASNAANKIPPNDVKAILNGFRVDTVNELGQDARQDFLDKLSAATADA
jgi:hypothetical protein